MIWAAGVTASELSGRLAELTGAELDRAGRIAVEPDLTLPGHPEVLALGDMVRIRDARGEPQVLPGVAPVAMQQGRYAAALVRARLRDRPCRPFRYRDKGNLATIGRARAVGDLHVLRLSGFPAWITWLVVHLGTSSASRTACCVLIRWAFSLYPGRGASRGSRRSVREVHAVIVGPARLVMTAERWETAQAREKSTLASVGPARFGHATLGAGGRSNASRGT